MIASGRIKKQLRNTLKQMTLKGLGRVERGKVRDSYRVGDRRIIVTTDRISAFDLVLGTIPFKGQVLNQLAAFWFEQSRDIVPNHVLDVPDPNVMVVTECEQLPVEFVVRGYITGVTKTSLWYNYEKGTRLFCGNRMPDGLRKNQKLERAILTPTTKLEAHDRPISRDEAIAEGLLDAETFDRAADICFKLYAFGVQRAAERGLILVDTKYELGRKDGSLIVTDELHTPDSSRYWLADTYAELYKVGADQRKIDKEYVREWLVQRGFRGEGRPPRLPDEVRIEAARRYMQTYETLTGKAFEATEDPVAERVASNLARAGYL